jgi:hypothetical protein
MMEWKRQSFPRKVVVSRYSQFDSASSFKESDFKSETFRFIGGSIVPYTKKGRNIDARGEQPIPNLINWNDEPLQEIPEASLDDLLRESKEKENS